MRCLVCGHELGSEGCKQPWPWLWRCSVCEFLCEDMEWSFGDSGLRRGTTRRYWYGEYPNSIFVPEGCLLVMASEEV